MNYSNGPLSQIQNKTRDLFKRIPENEVEQHIMRMKDEVFEIEWEESGVKSSAIRLLPTKLVQSGMLTSVNEILNFLKF